MFALIATLMMFTGMVVLLAAIVIANLETYEIGRRAKHTTEQIRAQAIDSDEYPYY